MEERAAKILAHEVAQPEEKERCGDDPVGERGGDYHLEHGKGRTRVARPAEMPAHQAHEIPRTVAFEGLAVWKDGGKGGHAAPQAQEQEVKTQIQEEKNEWGAEIKTGHGQNISEADEGEGRAVDDQADVGGEAYQ